MKAHADTSQLQRFIEAVCRTHLMDVFGRSSIVSELSDVEALREDWALVGEDLRTSMVRAADELSDDERERLGHDLVEAR